MRMKLLGFAAALVVAFGGAYLVGDAFGPIVDDHPAPSSPSGGFGHDHEQHEVQP